MSISSVLNRFQKLQLGKRNALKSSPNENIRQLWEDTNLNNVNLDSLLMVNTGVRAQKLLSLSQSEKASQHFINLLYQRKSVRSVVENISSKIIKNWANMNELLPGFIFNFVKKALQSQLPTRANLKRWGKAASEFCPLCHQVQSNKHVLSNCSNPVVLKRYTERHDKILTLLSNWLVSKIDNKVCKVFCDLPEFDQISDLFSSLRPDLALMKGQNIKIIELTVCHETNLSNSRTYKIDKYKDIQKHTTELTKNFTISVTTCEVSTLGFLQFYSNYLKDFNIPHFDEAFVNKLSTCAIQSSFDIYAHLDSIV